MKTRFATGPVFLTHFLQQGLALVIQCDFKAHNAMQMVIQDAPAAVEHATKTVTETFAKLDTPVKSSQKENIP